MGKIYKGQTKLKIELTVNQDITDATVKRIKYQKPSGETGYWPATVSSATAGVIYYEPDTTSILNEVGKWTLWAWVTFSDDRLAPGEPVMMMIYKEGT